MTEPLLQLIDVERHYPGVPPIKALAGVNLGIGQGEFLAIVGPSGSGKSTLLNIIGTLDRPTSGSVRIDGRDVAGLPDSVLAGARSARLGFVFQGFHLLETVSALDNVAVGLLYRGNSTKGRRAAAERALNQVGLGDRIHAKPSKLSGGQRQRVAIARAIVGEPGLLLADEPTGNLDTATGNEILGLLQTLNEHGTTVAVITHDHDLAERVPRRIHIRDGLIESDSASKSGQLCK